MFGKAAYISDTEDVLVMAHLARLGILSDTEGVLVMACLVRLRI